MLETNPTMTAVREQQETLELTLKNMKEVELVEKLKLENEKLRLDNNANQVSISRNALKNIKDSYYLATNILQTIEGLEQDAIDKLITLQKALANALYSTWYPTPTIPQQQTELSKMEEPINEATATESEPQPAA